MQLHPLIQSQLAAESQRERTDAGRRLRRARRRYRKLGR